jgi:hypothetical protein
LAEKRFDASGSAQIGCHAAHIGARNFLLNGFDGGVNASLRAPIDDDFCAFGGESGGNRQTYTRRRARHHSQLVS